MKKVFLDANIFFAAARSLEGGSGFILELAKKNKFRIITINYALFEAEKNIREKLDNFYLNCHYQNIIEAKPEIQSIGFISSEQIAKIEKFLPFKDVPILLGTILSNSEFLITLDKKHFLNNEKLKKLNFDFRIINPKEFLTKHILNGKII